MNWKRKLASRKFWALCAGFFTSVLVAFNFTENTIVQVTAIVTSFGSIAIYMLAESSVDKAALKGEDKNGVSN